MNYKVTRIIGVKDDVEVVKLSCEKKIKITPKEYIKKLLNFYDSWGVKLDFVEIEASPILVGQSGGRKQKVDISEIINYKKANPHLNQRQLASYFGVSKQLIHIKLKKAREDEGTGNC